MEWSVIKCRKSGQSLLEIIIIVALVAISILTLVKGFTASVGNSRLVSERTAAEDYAKEAIEWIGYQRDLDWDDLKALATGDKYCLPTLDWPAGPGVCTTAAADFVQFNNLPTIYRRELVLTFDVIGSEIVAVVTITWPEGNEFRMEKSFTDWR